MTDDLADWLRIRDEVDWAAVPDVREPATVDGIRNFVDTTVRTRDAERARCLLAALDDVRSDAAGVEPLSFKLLASWQRHVTSDITFRTGPAFAKHGREKYGREADTPEAFDGCLRQTLDPLPLAAIAARVYLDVLFFHPFPDGNGRAAMLALDFVLTRANAGLRLAGPVLMVVHNPRDGLDLARLIYLLISPYARGQRQSSRHRKPRSPGPR
jgi:Fic/DOC family protein